MKKMRSLTHNEAGARQFQMGTQLSLKEDMGLAFNRWTIVERARVSVPEIRTVTAWDDRCICCQL